MGAEICFDDYLRSLVSRDERSQDGYAQTDATDLFDFGLMAQTVQEQKERQKGQESQNSEQEESKFEKFPVLDGIRKYAADHVLLVGRPGSGKSTALRKMLVDEAQKVLDGQSSLIPVLIELRSWRTSYIALIKDFFRAHKLRLDETTIDDLLFEGKLLLLVDGVNELPANDFARQDIMTLRETNPDTPMIFTTRMLGVGGDLGIEKKLEMMPLSEPQMRQFIQMRLREQGNQMLQQLGDRLRKFGDTPLLLSMLCDVFQKNSRVPANLGAAFRDFANLHDGKLKEDVPVYEDSRSWWSKLLQQLAFAMMPQGRPNGLRLSIPRLEAEEILTRFLDGEKFPKPRHYAHRWLDDLLKYHLIQVKLVGTEPEIEFRHQLIQEYYAAEYLLPLFPNFTDIKLQHSYLNYLDWTESLALMLELVKDEDEEQAVRVVRLALEVDLRLGARLAGAVKYGFQEKTVGLLMREIDERKIPKLFATELLGETKSEFTIETLTIFLEEKDFNIKVSTVEALGKIATSRTIKPLILALTDQEPIVQSMSANYLGNLGCNEAFDLLFKAIRYNSTSVQWSATKALEKINCEKLVESLINILMEQEDVVCLHNNSRRNASQALSNLKTERATKLLIENLNHESDYVRSSVAFALGCIKSPQAVKPLIQSLSNKEYTVNQSAIWALGEIAEEEAVDIISEFITSQDYNIFTKSVEALGKINGKKSIELFLKLLTHKETTKRMYALLALGKIGGESVCETLVQVLMNIELEPIYIRKFAAKALGDIGNRKVVKTLIYAFKEQEDEVQQKAVRALGDIGSKKAIKTLICSLKSNQLAQSNILRKLVVEALGNIASDIAAETLIQVFREDQDSDIRNNAGIALTKIISEKTIKLLLPVLRDRNSEVRYSTVNILEKIGSNKAVIPLIQSFDIETEFRIQGKIAEALGKIGCNQAVDFLIQVLQLRKPKENFVRERIAQALGKIGDKKATNILIQMLADEDINVAIRAVEALGEISDEKSIDSLIQLLESKDSTMRWEVKEALWKIIAKADRNLPTLTQQLPHLLTLIPTEANQQALSVITAIQARCKYYNYDIAQTPLQETENHANSLESTLNELTKAAKKMSDAPKYDLRGAKIDKLIDTVNGGYHENNFAPEQKQNLAEAAKEIQDLLAQLNLNTPATNKAEEQTLVTRIIQAIQKFPNLRDIFLAGGIELVKIIFAPLGIPIEMGKKLLEAAEKEKQV